MIPEVQQTTTRAVVFSNFPTQYFKEHIEPKFAAYGIVVIRLVIPERQLKVDLADADIVLLFVDLIGHSQGIAVKEHARRHSKKVITLTRQESTWGALKRLKETETATAKMAEARKGQKLSLVKPAKSLAPLLREPLPIVEPVSVEVPLPPKEISLEQQLAEKDELLRLYEDENLLLNGQKTDWIDRLKKVDELNRALERQVETAQKELAPLKAKLTATEKQAATMAETNKELHRSNVTMTERSQRLMDEITALKKEPATVAAPIEKALEHFKGLWKSGFVTADDILKMIFKEK